nr:hypothetical protein [Tanacetum cinerariifolium]
MYDPWASRIRLFIKRNKNGRVMLDLIDNSPLVYPAVEENMQTLPKKYSELTEAQQLQDDCDVQAPNIILPGLPLDVYTLVNHQEEAKDIWDIVKLLMKGTKLSYQERECRWQPFKMEELQFNKFKEDNSECYWHMKQMNCFNLKGNYATGQAKTKDFDVYDSDCDDISSTKAVLMANLSSCDSDILFEELQDAGIQDTNSSAPNDLLVLSLVEQMTNHVANLDKEIRQIKCIKNKLIKLKGKNVVDTTVLKPSATIALGMFKLDIEPNSHILKNNRDTHEELLVYVSKTCFSLTKPCEKLVAVTPMNKDKKVGVNTTTSASGSKSSGNT